MSTSHQTFFDEQGPGGSSWLLLALPGSSWLLLAQNAESREAQEKVTELGSSGRPGESQDKGKEAPPMKTAST